MRFLASFLIAVLFLCLITFEPALAASISKEKYSVSYKDATTKIKQAEDSANKLDNLSSISYLTKKYPDNPYRPISKKYLNDSKTKLGKANKAINKLSKKDKPKFEARLKKVKSSISKAEVFTKTITQGNKFLVEYTAYKNKVNKDPLNEELADSYVKVMGQQKSLMTLIKKSSKTNIPKLMKKYDNTSSLIQLNETVKKEKDSADVGKQKEKIEVMLAKKVQDEKERLSKLSTTYTKTMMTNNELLNLVKVDSESANTIKWYGFELSDIDLYFTKEALESNIYLLDYAEFIMDEVNHYMGQRLNHRINVFIYDGPKISGTGNQYRVRGDYVFLNATDHEMPWDNRPVFAHEMVHALQGHKWNFEKLFPLFKIDGLDGMWLTEGMADYVSRHEISYKRLIYPEHLYLRYTNFDESSFSYLLHQHENKFNLTLSTLQTWPSSVKTLGENIVYESYIYYLEKKYGHAAFLKWVDMAVANNQLEMATQNAFGRSSKDISQEWKQFFKVGTPLSALSEITIEEILYREDSDVSSFPYLNLNTRYVLYIKEEISDNQFSQLFQQGNKMEFLLSSPGQTSITAYVPGGFGTRNKKGLQLVIPDYASMKAGNYTLSYQGTGSLKINIPSDLKLVKP